MAKTKVKRKVKKAIAKASIRRKKTIKGAKKPKPSKPKPKRSRAVVEWVVLIVAALLIALVVLTYIPSISLWLRMSLFGKATPAAVAPCL